MGQLKIIKNQGEGSKDWMDKSLQKLIIGYRKKQLESGMDVPDEAVADNVIDVQDSSDEQENYIDLDTVGTLQFWGFTYVASGMASRWSRLITGHKCLHLSD